MWNDGFCPVTCSDLAFDLDGLPDYIFLLGGSQSGHIETEVKATGQFSSSSEVSGGQGRPSSNFPCHP